MARTSIDRDSVEFLHVPVTAPSGVVLADLPVSIAVVSGSRPTADDWHEAAWQGSEARLVLGPGHVALTPGNYHVFVRITDSPEVPVLRAGLITVT